MRLSQIEQFAAVSSAGSISAAAKKLFVSQPNLSASMRELEKELGHKLFERSSKGICLTAFGSEFLAYAQPVLQTYGNLTAFCDETSQPALQQLTVASQYLRFASILFGKLCRECNSPEFDLAFLEGSASEIALWVANQTADIGLIGQTPKQVKANAVTYKCHDLTYTPLFRQKLSVILRKDHPLTAAGSFLRHQQLKGYPLILYRDTNYESWELVRLATENLNCRKIIVNSRAALYEALASTDAFTFGAHSSHAYSDNPYYDNISAIPLSDRGFELEIGCLVKRSIPISALAEKYLRYIRAAIKKGAVALLIFKSMGRSPFSMPEWGKLRYFEPKTVRKFQTKRHKPDRRSRFLWISPVLF